MNEAEANSKRSHRGSLERSLPTYGDLPARDAFSIVEFCRRNSISVSGFYQMKKEGWGPDTFYVGKRQLISAEAAQRWRAAREQAAATD